MKRAMRLLVFALCLSLAICTTLSPVASAVSSLSATLTNSKVGGISGYQVIFNLAGDGALLQDNGDCVDIFFDHRVDLPSSIAPADVQVNGVQAAGVDVSAAYGRVTIYPAGVIAGGAQATVTIDAAAGIRNPLTAGTYELGVRTSVEPVIRWATYSLTGSSVTNATVTVNPTTPGLKADYSVRFRTPNDLVAGEDTIAITFPTGITLPTSISRDYVNVNGVNLAETPVLASRTLTMVVPSTARAAAYVTVLISDTANVRNPSGSGTYSLQVSTSQDPSQVSVSFSVSSATTSATVTPNPLTANTTAAYTIVFTTSATGALSSGSTITIQFPSGTTIPSTVSPSAITVNGVKLGTGGVSRTTSSLTLTLPSGLSIAGSKSVTVVISTAAGLKNPPPDVYSLSVRTSADTKTVDSKSYEIKGGSVKNVEVTVTPPVVGVSAAYRVDFETSVYGALDGGSDQITIAFPSGTTVPSSISRSHITVNGSVVNTGSVSVSGRTITFTLPTKVYIDDADDVSVVISDTAGIKNPTTAAGTYKLTVSTSRDAETVTSPAYSILGGSVSNVVTTVTPPRAGRSADYQVQFRTGSDGALTGGNTITIKFPSLTHVPASITRSHIKVSNVAVNTGAVTVSGNTITFPIPTSLSIAKSANVTVTIAEAAGIVNPLVPGTYRLEVSTSKDPVPVQSALYTIENMQRISLTIGDIRAYVNERMVTLEAAPAIMNSRTMVPLRFIADSLGATTNYDSATRRITIDLEGLTILLTVNSSQATVGGRATTLDAPATVVSGRTLVPLRFISENFNSEVTWNDTTRTVFIER